MSSSLLQEIKQCTTCKDFLPLPPKPILQFSSKSKIVIIGQAPGRVVHNTELSFNDKSGDTLRKWLDVSREEFYNTDNFAIMPMGFCFPGKANSGGDAPPRKECAPQWHPKVLEAMTNTQLILLVGSHAINYYMNPTKGMNTTQLLESFDDYEGKFFPIVHPSPLNFRWHKNNPWFVENTVPILQLRIREILMR